MTVTNANLQKMTKPMPEVKEPEPVMDIQEEEEKELTVSEKYWRDKLSKGKKHGTK